MNLGGIRNDRQERMQFVPVLESTVLPQTRAGFALSSGPALCPISKGAWNQMTPEYFDRGSSFGDEVEGSARHAGDHAERLAGKTKIGDGAKAVNRLVLSLWLLLLPLFWPSSDWIGLLILSQAFLAAAKLIQPAFDKTNSAASPLSGVINMGEGEDCAQR